jgi:hypothetical protein
VRDPDRNEQRRDKLLLRLLKTPPQPRPKRERGRKVVKDETFEEFLDEAMRRFPQPPLLTSSASREEVEGQPRVDGQRLRSPRYAGKGNRASRLGSAGSKRHAS